jgi:hypothetical protein
MPFCLIPCRLLALAAMGRPRGALRAQNGWPGARFARTDACSGALRAQVVSATPAPGGVAVSQSFLPVGLVVAGAHLLLYGVAAPLGWAAGPSS